MKVFSYFLAVTVALTAFVGCTKNDSSSPANPVASNPQTPNPLPPTVEMATVQTIIGNDGQSIAHAQILIGSGVGTPFKANLITSDEKGQFLAPAEWTTAQSITISAPGYLRATYLAQKAKGQTFTIRKSQTHGSFELTGQTPGISVIGGDGNAYFSLVLPVLQKSDLLHFNIGMVLSPQNDVISVLGQSVSLPSNLTFPKQKQNYILPLTLNKPVYRTYFDTPGKKKVLALSGRFPFKKVVDELRGTTPFYLVANDMQIISGGIKEIDVAGAVTTSDIPANQFGFKESRSIASGALAQGEVLLGVAMSESNGDMIPSDVKVLNANALTPLKVQAGANVQVLSVLKRQTEMDTGAGEDRLSAVILPFTNGLLPKHLPLMENPRLLSNSMVQVQKLQVPAGLQAIATYGSLQSIQRSKLADGTLMETVTQVWEVYAPEWVDVIEVPTWPGESDFAAGNMRWSVAYVAGQSRPNLDLGPTLMQAVSHVTNASIDF